MEEKVEQVEADDRRGPAAGWAILAPRGGEAVERKNSSVAEHGKKWVVPDLLWAQADLGAANHGLFRVILQARQGGPSAKSVGKTASKANIKDQAAGDEFGFDENILEGKKSRLATSRRWRDIMRTTDNEAMKPAPAGGVFGVAGMMGRMEIAMKWVVRSLIVSGVVLTGCGGPTGKQGAGSAVMQPVGQSGGPVAIDDAAIPPADALWTIACAQIKGSGHVERAKVYKQQIAATTGLKGFYVVHEDDLSTLYFGFYKSIDPRASDREGGEASAKEGARAQNDLARMRSFLNGVGDPIFPQAGMSPLVPADPQAPAEWDLRNVDRYKRDGDPTKACWSLEIAVYKDSPQRKQAAVDSVREMREKGIKDAYFYHGKTSSSVCIGTWPEAAVTQIVPERGSSDDQVLVMPQGMVPGMKGEVKGSDGHKIRAVELKAVPVDPTLLDTMSKYPARAVNGYDIKHTYKGRNGGLVERLDPSLVIYIPRLDETSALNASRTEPTTDNGMAPVIDPNVSQPGGGRLRSINSTGGGR